MDEAPSTSGCKKRKRPSKETANDSDNDAEYELYTKYFNTDPRRKKYYCKTYAKNEEPPKKAEFPRRKRKYCYTTEEVGPKKVGKFSYLTHSMTKQRKRKPDETKNLNSPPEIASLAENNVIVKQITNNLSQDEETVLQSSKYNNCDLFHNNETGCSYEASKKQDLSFYIFDEIALEGLDGITIEAFWKRIGTVFPARINKTMSERIWRTICNNKHIDLHILEKAREELVFNIRSNYLDLEKGECFEPFIEFNDIYPLEPVNDGDVRGSCSTFTTRKRNNMAKKYSLEKAVSTYGRKLVIVADQVLRNKALFSNESDPNVECIDIEYSMLERIGRSRYQGEISQGNMSLNCMEGDSHKSIHHNRKNMEKNALIATQPFFLKSITAQQNKMCTLVHLPRFYHKRKTKQIMIMERISRLLKDRPNCEMEMKEFWSALGRQMPVVKITKTPEFRKFFSISLVPYRRLYPNAMKSEYIIKSKKKERMVRVVRLLDPTVNLLAIYENKDSAATPSVIETKRSDQPAHFFHDSDVLRNVYKYIASCGSEGAVTQEILESVQMDFYGTRLALRKLLARDLLSTKKIDSFRQQSGKFYPKYYDDPEIQLNTTIPKKYELGDRILAKLRAQNELNLQPDAVMYSGSESEVEPVLISGNIQISNSISTCAIFQTDISHEESEGINICDIIAIGRDRLLLAHSNLLMFFESEDLDKYILKRLNFIKTTPFFMYGFGKVVCDFLNGANLSKAFTTDNLIVFSEDEATSESQTVCSSVHMFIQVAYFTDGYDGEHEYDMVAKVYLFEALFDENHVGQKAGRMLKNIFERLQVQNGLKKLDQRKEKVNKINLEITSQVIMEKFMGPKPEMVFSQEEKDGVKLDIYISTPPSKFVEPGTEFKSLEAEKTRRFEDRANLALKLVYDKKVVRDTFDFVKIIREKEKEEGFARLVCRKSVKRIITTLMKSGYVKVIKVVLTGKNLIKARSLICLPNVNHDHSSVQSTIDELRMKFSTAHRASVGHSKTTVKTKSQSPFSSADVKNSILELKQLVGSNCRTPTTLDCAIARIRYGYSPKFVRMRIMHEFLFYLIRDMRMPVPLPLEEVLEFCDSFKIKMRKEDVTSLPPVYRKEISWRMFIPPLPKHKEWPTGWALACDITLRLPLSVYLKLYNTRFEIPEIEPYIRHPIKRHFLLKHLPPNVRNLLLFKRKYLFSIHEIFCNLCYIGLLQMGPRHYKEKDQIFIYLNENAALLDTCSSAEGYNKIERKQYKKLTFKFRIAKDVEQYWMEMWRICINTPLGRRKIMQGKYVTVEKSDSKPSMMETLKPATPQTAPGRDTGRIPGDHLGAAGFDSSLWSYVKRNWLWSIHLSRRNVDLQSHVTGLRKEQMKNVLPKPVEFEHLSKLNAADNKAYVKRPALAPSTHKVSKPAKTRKVISSMKNKRKIVRKVLPYPVKEKRQYNDALDEGIMRKNKNSRIGWDDDEDTLLRLFKVGAIFLCPQIRNQTIPYTIMRDIMHRFCPKSRNKTSRCIQRRLHHLIINDNLMRIMEANVENLLNSEVISKYFEQLHDRYTNGEKVSNNNINVAYIYLMSYMIEHSREMELLLLGYIATVDFFSEPYIELFSLLLHNLEMENVQDTYTYTSPRSVDDITRDTIKSIIHCSLSCKKDSPGWAYHLFHIYRNFPDEIIRSVVIELRKKHFLTISKMSEGKQTNWHIPIKFSYLYNTMKSSTYTIEMFLEAYQGFKSTIDQSRGVSEGHSSCEFLSFNEISTFLQNLRFVFDIPEMGIILNPAFEDHTEVMDELSKRLHLYLQRIHESQKVEKENVVESIDNIGEDFEKVKTCVTRIIFRVPYLMEGALDVYYKKLMDSTSSLEINNYIFLMTIDLKNFARSNILSKPELKKFVDDIEDYAEEWGAAVKNLSKVVFVIQQYNKNQNIGEGSLEAMFEKWESEELNFDHETTSNAGISTRLVGAQFAIKNISNGMDYCLKKAIEGEFPSVDEIKEGMMADFEESEKRKIPHITDVTMLLSKERFPDLDADEETVRLWKEHFVYQYPKLDKVLIEDADGFLKIPVVNALFDEDAYNTIFIKVQKPVSAKKPNLLDVLDYISSEGGGEDEVQFVEHVIRYVEKKMQLGATGKELKDNFLGRSTLDFHRLLQSLCSMKVFLRAGVSEIVFVHYKFLSEWMVDTFSFTDEEKELFQSKNKNDAKRLRNDIAERLKYTDPLKVVLKPWTSLDGSLNKPVLIEWLCVVLSHCLDNPNIPFHTLCLYFSHLKPVDVFYLVEVLQSIGSIEINLSASTSPCLVSSRKEGISTKATFLDNFEEMAVTSMGAASLCMGAYLEKEHIGQELPKFVLD